jgi:hypothetical protein
MLFYPPFGIYIYTSDVSGWTPRDVSQSMSIVFPLTTEQQSVSLPLDVKSRDIVFDTGPSSIWLNINPTCHCQQSSAKKGRYFIVEANSFFDTNMMVVQVFEILDSFIMQERLHVWHIKLAVQPT